MTANYGRYCRICRDVFGRFAPPLENTPRLGAQLPGLGPGTRFAKRSSVNPTKVTAMRLVKSMMFMMIATGVLGVAFTLVALGA